MISLLQATEKVLGRSDLTAAESEALFAEVLNGGADTAQLAEFLLALREKGECGDEITGSARAMRKAGLKPAGDFSGAIDTCGTGGDGQGGFNVSTAAALLACAAGAKVVKHGNRSVSSKSGSADLLEALGIKLEMPPAAAGELYEKTGFTFLFAPVYHPAMKHAAPVRKSLGVRTIFNLLGPLTNPAGVQRQLLGIYSPALFPAYAQAVSALGTEHTLLVHGGGFDEIISHGETEAREIRGGMVKTDSITPEAAGLERTPREPAGGDAAANSRRLRAIFAGENDAATTSVVLNAAHALVIAGLAGDARAGAALAAQALRSGAARAKLDEIIAASRAIAEKPSCR
jgi:anthranilate phosphoribosyltransferase